MTSDEMQTDAADVVEGTGDDELLIDPETGWNRLIVEQMARDIQIAHDVNASSWVLGVLDEKPNDPILSVGGIWVATLVAGSGGRLLVDAGYMTDE